MKVIADLATAERLGHRLVEITRNARSHRPFQYQQRSTGLTLFGTVLTMADGSETEVRLQ